MTPRDCLMRIMRDAGKIDYSKFDNLNGVRRDAELNKITKRWLKWISSVENQGSKDTKDEEE